ncbi:MAG: nucleoside/nucleotide kinase family protein [Rhodoglobus sp.]
MHSSALDELCRRAIPSPGERKIIGIVGPPGAGKSTLAGALREWLGDRAAVLPMDGFHLANSELERLELAHAKGSPPTFDVWGYVSAVERTRNERDRILYVPEYRRTLEEGIAGAIAISPDVDIVLTEGNYLLLDAPGWREIPPFLDEVWFLDPPATDRREHLEARHRAFGKSVDEAARWVATVDEPNAMLIQSGRDRADLVIDRWVS